MGEEGLLVSEIDWNGLREDLPRLDQVDWIHGSSPNSSSDSSQSEVVSRMQELMKDALRGSRCI